MGNARGPPLPKRGARPSPSTRCLGGWPLLTGWAGGPFAKPVYSLGVPSRGQPGTLQDQEREESDVSEPTRMSGCARNRKKGCPRMSADAHTSHFLGVRQPFMTGCRLQGVADLPRVLRVGCPHYDVTKKRCEFERGTRGGSRDRKKHFCGIRGAQKPRSQDLADNVPTFLPALFATRRSL